MVGSLSLWDQNENLGEAEDFILLILIWIKLAGGINKLVGLLLIRFSLEKQRHRRQTKRKATDDGIPVADVELPN